MSKQIKDTKTVCKYVYPQSSCHTVKIKTEQKSINIILFAKVEP